MENFWGNKLTITSQKYAKNYAKKYEHTTEVFLSHEN